MQRGKKMKPFLRALTFYCFNNFISHMPFYSLRHWYVRIVLRIPIGKKSSIHMGCFITENNIKLGAGSVVNRNCNLDGRGGLSIGSNVAISPDTYILSLGHDPQSPTFETKIGPVVIDDYVWIGSRAMILPGVTLGKGCVVGAGAIVTKNVAPLEIVAGVPAKVIGKRTEDLRYCPAYTPYFNTDIGPLTRN
jgi:acetyltransferase-like isoleucine patch superfamily enzyme